MKRCTGSSSQSIRPLTGQRASSARCLARAAGNRANPVAAVDALYMDGEVRGTLEIRFVSARHRKEVLAEMISVVFCAHHLQQLVWYFVPAAHHVERLVESVGVFDLDQGFQRLAVGGQLETLDDMQLLGMRRAKPIEIAVLGLQSDGVDHQGVAVLVVADRLAEP